jgi:AmiR/NasT family two-component response regulator
VNDALLEAASAAQHRAIQLKARTEEVLARAEDVIRRSGGMGVARVHHLRDEVDGLRQAMASRAVIEQAKGILMATAGVDADGAFDLLRQQSQHENRKLRDIAQALVDQQQRAPRGPSALAG